MEEDLRLQIANEAKKEETQEKDEKEKSMEVNEATSSDIVANVPPEKSMEDAGATLSNSATEHAEATVTDVVANVAPENITSEPDINQMLLGVDSEHACCCVCCPNGTTHPGAPITPTNKGGVSKPIYKCNVCGREFAKATNYQRHMERFNEPLDGETFKCKFCSHVFNTKNARKSHQAYHRKVKSQTENPICPECGQTFSSRSKLSRHLQQFTQNTESRMYKCFFCDHEFEKEEVRNRHESLHGSNRRLPCCCCGGVFVTR